MSAEQQNTIRMRAIDVVKRLKNGGYDRASIVSFAAEMLGQLTTNPNRSE